MKDYFEEKSKQGVLKKKKSKGKKPEEENKSWDIVAKQCPQQENLFDCGVLVWFNMMYLCLSMILFC